MLKRIAAVAICFTAFTLSAGAQYDAATMAGLVPYQAYHGGDIDSVNMLNGFLTLKIPLISYKERGNVSVSYSLVFNSALYAAHTWCDPTNEGNCKTVYYTTNPFNQRPSWFLRYGNCSPPQGQGSGGGGQAGCTASPKDSFAIPHPPLGVSVVSDNQYHVQKTQATVYSCSDPLGDGLWQCAQDLFTALSVVDSTGASHPMAMTSAGHYESLDGSSLALTSDGTSVIDPNGVKITGSVMEDTNGNQITLDSGTGLPKDTVGRVIPGVVGSTLPNFAPPEVVAKCSSIIPDANAGYTWSLPGQGTGTSTFTFCYGPITYNNMYSTDTEAWTQATAELLEAVIMPDDTTYWRFTYTADGWANLAQVQLPTGGTLSYTWQPQLLLYSSSPLPVGIPAIMSRTVSDGSNSSTWNYKWNAGTPINRVTDPESNDTVYTYSMIGSVHSYYPTTVQYFSGSSSGGTLLKQVDTAYSYYSLNDALAHGAKWAASMDATTPVFNIVPKSVTTTLDSGLVTVKTMTYDSGFTFSNPDPWDTFVYPGTYGKVVSESVFDYGPAPGGGSLLKKTVTSYKALQNSSYAANNLISLPSSVTEYDGNGTQVAATVYGYDEQSLQPSGIGLSQMHNISPWGGAARGNLTSVGRWLSGSTPVTTTNCAGSLQSGYLVATNTYYDTGELYQSTDPCLHTTTYQYGALYAGAYLTSVINAKNQNTSYTYDLNTALKSTETDSNGQITTYTYNDPLNRLTDVYYPPVGSPYHVNYAFNDVIPTPSVTVTESGTSMPTRRTELDVDGLGRFVLGKVLTDPIGTSFVRKTYDGNGRVYKEWNPTRCNPVASPGSCAGETTWGVTTHLYDGLGRETTLIPPDGTESTNNVSTAYAGNTVTVTDQAGVSRQTTTNALGWLTQVNEVNMGWVTAYKYDGLGNLLCVEQHGGVTGTGCSSSLSSDATSPWRVRRFTYDSLSRLITAKNPETGTVSYTYDFDGSPVSKTDNRGIKITYGLDQLHRMTSKTYSNSDPAVSYAYDASNSNNFGIGRRTSMSDASGTTSWTYDAMGRELSETRTIGSVQKAITKAYYPDGSTASITYPSGTTVQYALSGTGSVLSVTDSTHNINYASSLLYTPGGVLTKGVFGMVSGGFAGITETDSYNSRLQPLTLSSASPSATLYNLTYDFGLNAKNNGNVYGITNSKSTTRSMKAWYDGANRITQAVYGQTAAATTATGKVTVTGMDGFYCVTSGTNVVANGASTNSVVTPLINCNGTLIYDAGYITISVGTTSKTINYGQNDTALTVATALTAAFNNDSNSVVTAALSGTKLTAVVTFTTKATGHAANYALSTTAVTWQDSYFASPTIKSTASGATLTGGTDPTGTFVENYTSDAWGNMIPSGSITLNAAVGVNNRFTTYSYDNSGNLTSRGDNSSCSGAVTYNYNADGQTTCSFGITYTYDGDGARVKKSGGTLYWGDSIGGALAESDLNGNISSEYIFLNGKRIARRDTGGAVYYYFSDMLGSSSVITDATGGIKNESDYYPYGVENVILQNLAGQHYKYTGKERDAESGNDYFGARYYASAIGRFLSPDWSAKIMPVPYASLGAPQSLNLYGYVQNNPLSLADPDGHCCKSDFESFQTPEQKAYMHAPPDEMDRKFWGVMGPIASTVIWPLNLLSAGANLRSGHYGAAALDAAAMVPGERLTGSVWKLGNFARGVAIERMLGQNLPSAFPVIDKFVGGVATSIKSLDLNAKTFQNAGKLTSTVEGYVDKVAAFNGASYGGKVISTGQITGRELQLAVPGIGNSAQQAALQNAAAYAAKQGVKLSITRVH